MAKLRTAEIESQSDKVSAEAGHTVLWREGSGQEQGDREEVLPQ